MGATAAVVGGGALLGLQVHQGEQQRLAIDKANKKAERDAKRLENEAKNRRENERRLEKATLERNQARSRQRSTLLTGSRSTMLTGGRGLSDEKSNTQLKTLLGQ